MNKLKIILFAYVICTSILGAEGKEKREEINKADHELFLLVIDSNLKEPRDWRGEDDFRAIDLYEKPSMDSKIVFSHKLESKYDKYKNNRGHAVAEFNNKIRMDDFAWNFSSNEKNGDFYKITYEGKEVWIHKKYFEEIIRIDDCLTRFYDYDSDGEDDSEFSIAKKGTILYKNINKNKIEKDLSKLETGSSYELDSIITSFRFVKKRLWLKVVVGKGERVSSYYLNFKPFEAWVSPWTEAGKRMYQFGSGYCKAGAYQLSE